MSKAWPILAVYAAIVACRPAAAPAEMTFFVTSVHAGDGGNIGGLAGADAHCQKLAEAAGSVNRHWRAYLSGEADGRPEHARDRIGRGPWVNVKGVQIAASVDQLHESNKIDRLAALTEQGKQIPHDILTGSNPDGTLMEGDATCRNWTSTEGHAMVGHSNKEGRGDQGRSWNSAHLSDGCGLAALKATAGAGLFYCFAVD